MPNASDSAHRISLPGVTYRFARMSNARRVQGTEHPYSGFDRFHGKAIYRPRTSTKTKNGSAYAEPLFISGSFPFPEASSRIGFSRTGIGESLFPGFGPFDACG